MKHDITIRTCNKLIPYQLVWDLMKQFTIQRDTATSDEIWLLQHQAVFTQGLAGKPEHVLDAHNIPIVRSDRGGQVTYHGPGQLMVYLLLDLNRLGLNTRSFVCKIEQVIIDFLMKQGVKASRKTGAPGVYINNAKLASIGLRIRRGYSYHGVALNLDMDLTPFSYINPCGYEGLSMTQIKHWLPKLSFDKVRQQICTAFVKDFGYNSPQLISASNLEHPINDQA